MIFRFYEAILTDGVNDQMDNVSGDINLGFKWTICNIGIRKITKLSLQVHDDGIKIEFLLEKPVVAAKKALVCVSSIGVF